MRRPTRRAAAPAAPAAKTARTSRRRPDGTAAFEQDRRRPPGGAAFSFLSRRLTARRSWNTLVRERGEIPMRRLILLSAGLAAAAAAQPAARAPTPVAPSAQGDVSVTIYNDDLALVQDTRQLDIPAGRTRLEFPDVSAQIRAETVSFAAPDTGIVEQNFDYDLLSPAKLMEKAVGKTVTIVRVNPATGAETREQAKILATNGGVVLQIGSRIEVLRDDGLPVRVIFDQVPPNLRARPTLSVTVESSRPGRRPARLTYLTRGLGWRADYVAAFDEAAAKIDVQGWITLSNNSGTSYTNAQVVMVAGTLNQGDNDNRNYRPYRPSPPPPRSA